VLERFLPGAAHLQNLHPLIVHFPIAFLYAAALLYLAAFAFRRDALAWGGFWMLAAGIVSAAAAVGTGLYARPGVMLTPEVKDKILEPHMRYMLATSAVAIVLMLWAIVQRPLPLGGRYFFVFGLLVMLALMSKGADLGGMMVYDYNAGGGACPQPIQYAPNGSPAM
jgi:uncharacterized membrane protein